MRPFGPLVHHLEHISCGQIPLEGTLQTWSETATAECMRHVQQVTVGWQLTARLLQIVVTH